jgi:hypothetical protein
MRWQAFLRIAVKEIQENPKLKFREFIVEILHQYRGEIKKNPKRPVTLPDMEYMVLPADIQSIAQPPG